MSESTLRDWDDFAAAGLLDENSRDSITPVMVRYAAALTPDLADLIDRADPHDPIARQFVPSVQELNTSAREIADPIGDEAHSPVEGIVHRYPDRVLLKLLTMCPVYCRFCFRREKVGPGKGGTLSDAALDQALDYIGAHPAIWEVILTGGDPLALSPRRLARVMQRLGSITHVKIVRIHTRVPVVQPARIDAAMLAALRASGKTIYVALHANHARELSAHAVTAIKRIIGAGIPMVSQSVLLAGVNDDPLVLAQLMRRFVELRITPYYLHHPDLAPGTAHFRVPVARGRAIVSAMQAGLSGLAQPRYVLDIPGGHGKVSLGEARVVSASDTHWQVTDRLGRVHDYHDDE